MTSTAQEDVQPFLAELRALVRDKGLVLVNENKLRIHVVLRSAPIAIPMVCCISSGRKVAQLV